MFTLPVFVGIDYHARTIQVCVMDSTRTILANQSVTNDPEAVFRVVAPLVPMSPSPLKPVRVSQTLPKNSSTSIVSTLNSLIPAMPLG